MPESNRTAERWAVKDKKRLLVAMIVGDARMSIEGDLRGFRLMPIAGASDQETDIEKKHPAAETRLHRCATRTGDHSSSTSSNLRQRAA
jgi:hypothetical protein